MMKPTKQNFSLGQLVATRGVDNLMNRNQAFRAFVQLSLSGSTSIATGATYAMRTGSKTMTPFGTVSGSTLRIIILRVRLRSGSLLSGIVA